jgi:predicted secreted protein
MTMKLTSTQIANREAELKAELKNLKAAARAAAEAEERAKIEAIAAMVRKSGLHKFEPALIEAGLQKLATELIQPPAQT